jgi:hypothetical protein
VNDDELLQRYLDGELSSEEACAFRVRLLSSPELQRELTELQLVGGLVRRWADEAGERASSLVQPTLARVDEAAAVRSRHASLGMAVAAVMLVLLPGSGQQAFAPLPTTLGKTAQTEVAPPPVAIERLEAGDRHAQVFVVGKSSTPVVWLADEASEETTEEQDPG